MSSEKMSKQINDSIKKLSKAQPSLPTNRIRVIIALEKTIVRLESHPTLAKHLVFKGGFVLFKILMNPRFTRDIDTIALDIQKNGIPNLIELALKKDIHDGLWFEDIQTEDLTDQGIYGGFRFNFAFHIGDSPVSDTKIKKLSRIHLDVGFGDIIDPLPQTHSAISIIPNGESLSWLIYPDELDTSILKGAWNSVQFLESPKIFDEVWNLFRNQLQILDESR